MTQLTLSEDYLAHLTIDTDAHKHMDTHKKREKKKDKATGWEKRNLWSSIQEACSLVDNVLKGEK